jgi:hypothetical protein
LEVEVPVETPTTIKALAVVVVVPQKSKRYQSRALCQSRLARVDNEFSYHQGTQPPPSMHLQVDLDREVPLETLSHWAVLAAAAEAREFCQRSTRL